MLCRAMLSGLVVAGLALAAPVAAPERCRVTDPTGTPLNVRRFDGKVLGSRHNGEIVKILRTSADRNGKQWAYVAYETNGEGWVYGSSSAATEADRRGPEAPSLRTMQTERQVGKILSPTFRVAGAYWRSSLIFLTDSGELRP